MSEPAWISLAQAIDIHAEQLAIFGGPEGVRDAGALESALHRPVNQWHYGTTDLVELAAAYAFGIARNHPFVDGNKRAAFLVMITFLRKNGLAFSPDQSEAAAAILALAAGELDEAGLARWIGDVIAGRRKQLRD